MNGKKLTRSRTNRLIGGVAAGIGEYLNVDPVLIRILFVFLIPFGGVGFVAYLIMLIVMPEDQSPLFPPASETGAYVVDEDGCVADNNDSATIGEEKEQPFQGFSDVANPPKERNMVSLIIGVLLMFFGIYILVMKYFSLSWFEFMFPLLLLVIGLIIIIVSLKSKNKNNA